MSNLYIIGNGFDIAHDLDTSYWAFRTYLENNHLDFLLAFEQMYNIQQLDPSEYGYTIEAQKRWDNRVYDTLWSSFEKFMGFPNVQEMLDTSTSVLDDMDLDGGNYGIKGTMDEYWRSEFGFIRDLQKHVKEWISSVDISTVAPKKSIFMNNSDDYFFNFNYTTVLEDVYNVEDVIHIHGSIGSNADYSPVMGHCNQNQIDEHSQYAKEAFELDNEGETSIHEAVVNYLTAIYKDTEHYIGINKWFFNRLKPVEKVIIFGWAAGEVDIPYLNVIRNSVSKDAEWEVYFHDKKSYDSLHNAFRTTRIFDDFKTPVFIESCKFWDK